MKTSQIVKITLLALPVVTLLYIFHFRDLGNGKSIGGGSYDLTKLYYSVFAAAYLLVLNLVLLVQDAKGNRFFLLAGLLFFIGSVAAVVRCF